MASVDLRTYLLLERAFVRRLQRSWRIQSAPTYAKITQHCLDKQWDKARQLVPDLDMAEVGTENREWITYMLHSFAVFGASTVARNKPSFVGVGSFDTFLKQVTSNFLQYLELNATAQVQAEALQAIAEDEAKSKAVKFDPAQPRDAQGRWARTQSTAFKTWFKDSKVVDEQGRPKEVYKAMYPYDYRFEGKDKIKGPLIESIQRQTPFPDYPEIPGAPPTHVAGFFTDSPKVAEGFVFGGGAIYPVYLSIQKPLIIDAAGKPAGAFQFGPGGQAFREATRSGEYDGIIFENTKDEGTVYVPLKPEQIKSSLANVTFDSTDPRIHKFDPAQPRDAEGQWTKTGGVAFDPAKKETWYRKGGGWHTSPEGDRPYGWNTGAEEGYEVPPLYHKPIRGAGVGVWGGSHSGSSLMTGESAKQMGIDGYQARDPQDEVIALTTRMLDAIATDAHGSEESLYHTFENVEGTTFRPGDTMDLPLTATAGQPETGYGKRLEQESQKGPPTVLVFPKGTKMVAYGMWPTDPKQRGYEDGNAQEFGHVYSEAIVAGRFRVVKVETVYMGSQHNQKPVEGEIPQLYGQVVHLEPIGYFNPATGKWEDHG